MRIWIDIGHTPQFNFYKQFILMLAKAGHRVYVTVLGRGRLPQIVQHELSGVENVSVEVIGRHRMTKWSAYVEVNLLRIPQLLWWALGKKIDIAFSNHHQTSLVARVLRIPGYAFGDDPQTKLYPIHVKAATQSHMLIYEDTTNGKILPGDKVMPCLKEWAYLNPRTFVPNVNVLKQYGVKPKEYIFLREVSVGTINYTGQESGAILGIKDMLPKNVKVLFSLEEKKRRNEYPEDWILLQEPIEDIHSLIYYAAGLVSSGDSMAREAALLGVPAYYLGIRYTMPANKAASKVAGLQNRLSMPFKEWIESLEDASLQFRGEREIENKNININININNTASAEINNENIIVNQKSGDSVCCEQHPQNECSDSSIVSELPSQTQLIPSNSVSVDTESSPYKNEDLQPSKKNTKNNSSQAEMLLQRQVELGKHIDEEFIDVNQYMLELVEKVEK